jgi:hypothetical protein
MISARPSPDHSAKWVEPKHLLVFAHIVVELLVLVLDFLTPSYSGVSTTICFLENAFDLIQLNILNSHHDNRKVPLHIYMVDTL